VARHTRPTLPVLLLASALLPASVATRAQPQRAAEQSGLSGYVVAPDGTPVPGGRVVIQPGIAGSTTTIERTGRFRLIPNMSGVYQLSVSVPGLAPYRVSVVVPPSRTLKLPVIRLSPPTYFARDS
jgi:Carboxypeptidase regulatory-like domain